MPLLGPTLPSLSVVIPLFNAAEFIAATLDSVLSQSRSDLECIVVDDGSEDGSPGIVEHYVKSDSRVRLLRQGNAGPSAARNHGLAAADPSAVYVMFLDHDDVLEPHALKKLVEALERQPGAAGAHGLVRFIDEQGDPYLPGHAENFTRSRVNLVGGRVVRWPREASTNFGVLLLKDFLHTPGSLLARRSCVARVGGYDPGLSWNADWDFTLRLATFADLAFLDEVVLRYRKWPGGMSGGSDAVDAAAIQKHYDRERRVMLENLIASPDVSAQQRSLIRLADRRADAVDATVQASLARLNLRSGRLRRAARFAVESGKWRVKAVLRPTLSRLGRMSTRSLLSQ